MHSTITRFSRCRGSVDASAVQVRECMKERRNPTSRWSPTLDHSLPPLSLRSVVVKRGSLWRCIARDISCWVLARTTS